jgi:hypothetical protein
VWIDGEGYLGAEDVASIVSKPGRCGSEAVAASTEYLQEINVAYRKACKADPGIKYADYLDAPTAVRLEGFGANGRGIIMQFHFRCNARACRQICASHTTISAGSRKVKNLS